jgi:predicted nucleic acid-binding protein
LSIVLDTGFVVTLLRKDDENHRAACDWLASTDEDLITTPLALAEIDHMVTSRLGGRHAANQVWEDFDSGAYGLRWWAEGLHDTIRIARQHPFLGLTDASLVALAGILRTNRIATFDQHFRSVLTPDGEPFVVLPADR